MTVINVITFFCRLTALVYIYILVFILVLVTFVHQVNQNLNEKCFFRNMFDFISVSVHLTSSNILLWF